MNATPTQLSKLFQELQDEIKNLDHRKIAENTLERLGKGYSNGDQIKKAVNDVLWGIGGKPEKDGPGAYNIPLMKYREAAIASMDAETQAQAQAEYRKAAKKAEGAELKAEELQEAYMLYAAKDPDYKKLAEMTMPYVKVMRDSIYQLPAIDKDGALVLDNNGEMLRNRGLAPFVGANTTIIAVDHTSDKAKEAEQKMLRGEISVSEFYKEHSRALVQTRADNGTLGASGGGLGNLLAPENAKAVSELQKILGNAIALQQWHQTFKDQEKEPSLKDLCDYVNGQSEKVGGKSSLALSGPLAEPYLKKMMQGKYQFTDEHHAKYIDNVVFNTDGTTRFATPAEKIAHIVKRESKEEIKELGNATLNEFDKIIDKCDTRQAVADGARDPSIALYSGYTLGKYDKLGQPLGGFPPTYTEGQSCSISEVAQEHVVETMQTMQRISDESISSKVAWKAGAEVANMQCKSLSDLQDLAVCSVVNGKVEPRRAQGPNDGSSADTKFCYVHEGQVSVAAQNADLLRVCEANYVNTPEAKSKFRELYLADVKDRATRLADMDQPRIIDFQAIADITKDAPTKEERLAILAREHFNIDKGNAKEISWALDMLKEAQQQAQEIYFSKHKDHGYEVAREEDTLQTLRNLGQHARNESELILLDQYLSKPENQLEKFGHEISPKRAERFAELVVEQRLTPAIDGFSKSHGNKPLDRAALENLGANIVKSVKDTKTLSKEVNVQEWAKSVESELTTEVMKKAPLKDKLWACASKICSGVANVGKAIADKCVEKISNEIVRNKCQEWSRKIESWRDKKTLEYATNLSQDAKELMKSKAIELTGKLAVVGVQKHSPIGKRTAALLEQRANKDKGYSKGSGGIAGNSFA